MKQKEMVGKTGYVDISIKNFSVSDDNESIEISGYANLSFEVDGTPMPDSDGDTVLPIGIDLTRFNQNPIMLYNHNRDKMIGIFTEVEQRAEGLWVRGTVYKSLNGEVYEAVRLGVLKTFSIGFRGLEGRWLDDDYSVYMFTKTELFEISIVTVPAAAGSVFTAVKMDCGSNCLAMSIDKKLDKEVDMTKTEVQELLKTFKEDLLKELQTQETVEKEVEEVDEKEVEEVATKEVSTFNIKDLCSLEITEKNFEEVVGALADINAKVNEFLDKQL